MLAVLYCVHVCLDCAAFVIAFVSLDGGDNAPATEGVAPVDGQPANNGQSANGPGPGQGANMLPPFPPFMVPPPFGLMPPPFGAVPSFGPVPPFGEDIE